MLRETLLRVKPARVITTLKDASSTWYVSNTARRAGLSYIHATKLLIGFEKDGLVFFERRGRQKQVRLTEKGMAIANLLDELLSRLAPPQPTTTQKEEKESKETREQKEQKEEKK